VKKIGVKTMIATAMLAVCVAGSAAMAQKADGKLKLPELK